MRTPSHGPPEPVMGSDPPLVVLYIPVADVIQEWDDDILEFIPLDPDDPGPSSAPRSSRHLSNEDNSRTVDPHPTAGRVIRMNNNLHTKWKRSFGLAIDPDGDIEMNRDSPSSRKARAVVFRYTRSTPRPVTVYLHRQAGFEPSLHQIVDNIPERAGAWAFKTLSFPDRPSDTYLIRYRDPLIAIRALLGNPAHAKDIVFEAGQPCVRRNVDGQMVNIRPNCPWALRLPQSLSPQTAQLQLTQFSGGKFAYPGAKTRNQKIFRASMRLILQPLIAAGTDGMDVEGGDGQVRKIYRILATYVPDYPEQCLVGCGKYGTWPKCLRSATCLTGATCDLAAFCPPVLASSDQNIGPPTKGAS
ncbi:hypothetical protein B0H19DRAFT_1085096 [Mycena capillaripes]|nr:hypothetical protein B0H19DRAFT_1085096 [Mycena capillaripes]